MLLSGDGDDRVFWLEQQAAGVFAQHVLELGIGPASGNIVTDFDRDRASDLVVSGYENNVVYAVSRP